METYKRSLNIFLHFSITDQKSELKTTILQEIVEEIFSQKPQSEFGRMEEPQNKRTKLEESILSIELKKTKLPLPDEVYLRIF